jgi:lysophospholipase L1-like esterase
MKDLIGFVEQLTKEEGEVVFYNHPMPAPIYEAHRESYDKFNEEMAGIIDSGRTGLTLLNYNNEDYSGFTPDYANYIDHWHFSPAGQARCLSDLKSKISRLS